MTSAGEPEGQLGPAEVRLVADLAGADGVEAPQLRELEGAPDVPAEAREELLALKSGAAFVCSRRDGDIRPGRASGEGLYVEDTRHLSELRLTVGGLPPVPLSSASGQSS
jgi:N-terminal domain of (some) glycogen debranching enzymes